MDETRWLTCRVEKGMFSSERLVWIRLDDGREVAFLVDQQDVRDPKDPSTNKGMVRVRVIESHNRKWMEIPTAQPVAVPADVNDLVAA